jgi:hypothetical protein
MMGLAGWGMRFSEDEDVRRKLMFGLVRKVEKS